MDKRPDQQPPGETGGEAPERGDSEHRANPADGTARTPLPKEIGGRDGPEPTRYGDWEKNGRCIDF
jgi:hypothetical protein